MHLFGKKKILPDSLAPKYVNNIIEVAKNGFTEIADYLNNEPEFEKSPNIKSDDYEWFLYIVFVSNLIDLENYFEQQKAHKLNTVFVNEFVKQHSDTEQTRLKIVDYENTTRDLLSNTKNLLKTMSLTIFNKYDLNQYQKTHFLHINEPNPVILKELNTMAWYFLWNWKEYLAKYRIVF